MARWREELCGKGRGKLVAQVLAMGPQDIFAAKSTVLFVCEVNTMVQLLTRRKISGLDPLLTFRCNPVNSRFH